MRLYGRRIADRAIFSRIDQRREYSEGILWTVDSVTETCTVKIQGSNEQIRAHYPRNLKDIPEWLRKGNAVKIIHKKGKRGYVEVVGPGRAIPNPITGSQFPTAEGLADGLLAPVYVTPYPSGSNTIRIAGGVTYRINDVTYYLVGGDGDFFVMGDGNLDFMGTLPYLIMGQIGLTLDANPSAGNYRYDILVAGTDGAVDIIKGSTASSNPSLPSTPSEHVFLEKILRVGGESGITIARIGQTWTTPAPTELAISGDDDLPWSTETNYPEHDLTMTVKDQYGQNLSNSDGWQFQCDLLYGTGQVYSGDSGYGNSVTQRTINSSYTFKYQRNQLVGERHPLTLYTLNATPPLQTTKTQNIRDEFGDLIGGTYP